MPVQINEVIIRTTVSNGSTSSGNNSVAAPAANTLDNASLVEQIMETIRDKKER